MTLDPDTKPTDQETPVAVEDPAETPSDPVVPDEQDDGKETPAQPDSDPEAADAVPTGEPDEKTPEQVKDDAAHWQSKYQESQNELKGMMDDGEASTPETPPAVTPAPAITPAPAERNLTNEEADEMLRDPRIQMQVQREWIREDVRNEIQTANAEERHRTQSVEANRVLQQFRHDQKIGDEDFTAASTAVTESGLKGSPAAINSAIIRELNYQRMMKHMDTQTQQTKADTAEKVKRQLLTTQPAAGGDQLKEVDSAKKLADAIAPKTTD